MPILLHDYQEDALLLKMSKENYAITWLENIGQYLA